MSDQSTLLAANAAFYDAFSAGDAEAMARLWAEDDGISCIHPGWPALVGRTAVIASWRDILRHAARPHIACRDPHAIVARASGHVLCIEMVESAPLAAANHFRLIDGVWRLVHHQSTPIATIASPPPDPAPPRRMH